MITTYFKNMVMDNLFHTTATKVFPAKYYIGWSTTPVTDSGTGFTEPLASTGYARIEATGIKAAVDGMVANANKLAFAESTSAQGTTIEYGIFDALSGGNLLIFNGYAADDQQVVGKKNTIFIKPDELQFTLKGL